MVRLFQLAKRLRDPGGCPWDAEQTHHSLTRYLLEESYEVVEAVEALPADGPIEPAAYAALEDELGDLLYQVVFHAVIAQESGAFTMADVARGIHDKLVRRHPHVFGDVVAAGQCRTDVSTSDVMRNWEQIKKDEKGTTSIVEGITPGLPSLLYTHKLFRKAASVGLDPGDLGEALDRIDIAVAASARRRRRPRSRPRPGARGARWSSPAPAASTPSPRSGAGPRPTVAASRPWSSLARVAATSTSPPSTPPASPPSGSRPRPPALRST